MRNGSERSTESTVNARKGYTRCRSSRLVKSRSFDLDSPHGVGAGNGVRGDCWCANVGQRLLRTSRVARLTGSGRLRDTLDEETADWRAVCGKTARTVRRAGRGQPFPTPINITCATKWRAQVARIEHTAQSALRTTCSAIVIAA